MRKYFVLAVMQMVVWKMRVDEVHRALPLYSHCLVVFFKQLKVKISLERERLSSKEFSVWWMTVVSE